MEFAEDDTAVVDEEELAFPLLLLLLLLLVETMEDEDEKDGKTARVMVGPVVSPLFCCPHIKSLFIWFNLE
jgi:hypothetical protein